MPWATSDRGRGSLVGRVALASALAAAAGGAAATIAASLSSSQLVERQDRSLLLDATSELMDETLEELADDDDGDSYAGFGTLGGALAHELEDVDFPGARAAVFERGAFVVGEPEIPLVATDTCVDYDHDGSPHRACARAGATPTEQLVFVLSVDARRQESQRSYFLISGLFGIVVAALGAALSARLAARWALAPLDALRDGVRAIDPDEPSVGTLATPLALVEVDELRASVAELVERLAGSLASARGFAAEAAHELRTPLTTIVGELDMIAESDAPIEKGTIDRLRQRVASLVALVQRLLVLVQPAKVDPAASEAVDLGDVVREVVDALVPALRERLVLELSDDVVVRGDSTLLAALVSNAVDNALKFSGRAVVVRVRADRDDRLVEVVDEGPGIPASERDAVFAPFYRLADTRARGTAGYGVGLALIAHVATLHGGTVRFVPSTTGSHIEARLPGWSPAD